MADWERKTLRHHTDDGVRLATDADLSSNDRRITGEARLPHEVVGATGHGDRPPHQPSGPAGSGPTVTFVRSNLAVEWDERFGSLLDFAEACDVPVGFGCRNGVCHNCESGLVEGAVAYDPEPLEAPPDGRVLVCCSRPVSELALDL